MRSSARPALSLALPDPAAAVRWPAWRMSSAASRIACCSDAATILPAARCLRAVRLAAAALTARCCPLLALAAGLLDCCPCCRRGDAARSLLAAGVAAAAASRAPAARPAGAARPARASAVRAGASAPRLRAPRWLRARSCCSRLSASCRRASSRILLERIVLLSFVLPRLGGRRRLVVGLLLLAQLLIEERREIGVLRLPPPPPPPCWRATWRRCTSASALQQLVERLHLVRQRGRRLQLLELGRRPGRIASIARPIGSSLDFVARWPARGAGARGRRRRACSWLPASFAARCSSARCALGDAP